MAFSFSTKLVFFACCFLMFTFSDKLVAGQSDKVQLNLYYESLCPGCQQFIINTLVEFFDTDLDTITDVNFFPFGNAELSHNQTIICQHGEEECKLNKIEACIIRTYPDPKLQYSFIRCVENYTEDWESSCFNGAADDINACCNSEISTELMLGYANQTLSLNPEHEFVPWVIVNSVPLNDSFSELVSRVCNAYQGTAPLPTQCNSTALAVRKVWSKLQVSYANEATNY